MSQTTVNRTVLFLLVAAISALFLAMIRPFLMAIFLAALFSAMARPVFRRFNILFKGRRHAASLTTLLLMTVVVMVPLSLLIGIVINQALDVGESAGPWIQQNLENPDRISDHLQHLPFYEYLAPYHETILEKAGELVTMVSKFLVSGLSSATLGTANFVFMAFVFLYTTYFFQMDGDRLIKKILYYLPLNSQDESLMLEKFTSVTRATLKGSLLIGMLQGGLAGLAFAVAGVDNAVFWGTVMAVLSIIPSIGSALVWAPAGVILISQGSVAAGAGLLLFCGLVVGSLDNILRPALVGRDTKLHELMIFFGTLGGIMMFGITGIFIGPLIASLFVTVWELYGIAFSQFLPEVYYRYVEPDAGGKDSNPRSDTNSDTEPH